MTTPTLSPKARATMRELHSLVNAMTWISVEDEAPPYSDDGKVLCYTHGHDYGGEQFHTIKASDFYDFDPEYPDFPGTELTKTVTHWMPEPSQAILSTSPGLLALLVEIAYGIVDLMPDDPSLQATEGVGRVIAREAAAAADRKTPGLVHLKQDPASSFWLKAAIDQAQQRDPLDALNDAEALAAALRKHINRLQRQHQGTRQGATR